MRYKLVILLASVLLTGCYELNKGLGMKVSNNEVCWKNSVMEFRTTLKPADQAKKYNPPAIDAYLTNNEGKHIHMPIDIMGLGYGASSPIKARIVLNKPDNGIKNAELLMLTKDKMVTHIEYEPWVIQDEEITLDKQITLYKESPIMSVIDYYKGEFELINVAAGLTTCMTGTISELENGYAVEYPNGVTAIIVAADSVKKSNSSLYHNGLLQKQLANDEPFRYWVGISGRGRDYLLEELAKLQ